MNRSILRTHSIRKLREHNSRYLFIERRKLAAALAASDSGSTADAAAVFQHLAAIECLLVARNHLDRAEEAESSLKRSLVHRSTLREKAARLRAFQHK